jgi:hypothetical protein
MFLRLQPITTFVFGAVVCVLLTYGAICVRMGNYILADSFCTETFQATANNLSKGIFNIASSSYCTRDRYVNIQTLFSTQDGNQLRWGKVVPVLNYLSTIPWIRMGSGGIAPWFLTSALDGGEWFTSRPERFTPGENHPRCPLDGRLGGSQSRSGRPNRESNSARSPSLYGLSYPGSYVSLPVQNMAKRQGCFRKMSLQKQRIILYSKKGVLRWRIRSYEI